VRDLKITIQKQKERMDLVEEARDKGKIPYWRAEQIIDEAISIINQATAKLIEINNKLLEEF
jgi:hypothetical protein